jgi:hypothetical protein
MITIPKARTITSFLQFMTFLLSNIRISTGIGFETWTLIAISLEGLVAGCFGSPGGRRCLEIYGEVSPACLYVFENSIERRLQYWVFWLSSG